MMEDFERLVALCKADVHLAVNEHKANYQTVAEFFEEMIARGMDRPEELARMVAADTIYTLQVYPRTPIGSTTYCGDRPGPLILEAIKDLENETRGRVP